MDHRRYAQMLQVFGARTVQFLTTYTPIATVGLIIMNLVMMVGSQQRDSQFIFGLYALIPSNASLLKFFTSLFLHVSFAHFAGNMALLWLFGKKVELAVDSVDFLLIYAACGFASSILHVMIVFAFMPSLLAMPIVGSSGAIAGIMGVFSIRFFRDKFTIGNFRIPAIYVLFTWLGVQLLMGILGLFEAQGLLDTGLNLRGVGHWAHIGGFIFGMGIALLLQQDREAEKDYAKKVAAETEAPLDRISRFYRALEMDPEDPATHAALALTWANIDDYAKARDFYSRATELYLGMGKLSEPLRLLSEYRDFVPDGMLLPDIHHRLASTLEKEGRYEDALREFTMLSHAESAEVAQMALLRIGHIHLRELDRPRNAMIAYQRFLATWPDSPEAVWAKKGMAEAERKMSDSPGGGQGRQRTF